MPDALTFGRYAEIPYDRMTPEQDGYRALIEARGALAGPNRIFVHSPKSRRAQDRESMSQALERVRQAEGAQTVRSCCRIIVDL